MVLARSFLDASMLRAFLVVMIVSAAVGAITPQDSSYRSLLLSPTDSALVEFEAGRFWHAARMLREEEAAAGGPEDVLLLARAEAGWGNWSAVAELLNGAEWLPEESGAIGLYLLGRAWEAQGQWVEAAESYGCLLYTSPSPRDLSTSRMPSSA